MKVFNYLEPEKIYDLESLEVYLLKLKNQLYSVSLMGLLNEEGEHTFWLVSALCDIIHKCETLSGFFNNISIHLIMKNNEDYAIMRKLERIKEMYEKEE